MTNQVITQELCESVDKLGALNAKIAALVRQADVIKADLKASGFDIVEGYKFKAVVSCRTTARLDNTAVRAILTPAQVDLCTRESTSTSVSLYDL